MAKYRKILDKPAGYGQIRTADGKSLRVHYSLVLFQTVDSDADTGPASSLVEVRGGIAVDKIEGLVNLAGKCLTLKTNDGRCMAARVEKGDPVTRHWEIVSNAPDPLAPC